MIEERGIFYTTMWSSIRREPGRAALVTSKNADDEAVSLRFQRHQRVASLLCDAAFGARDRDRARGSVVGDPAPSVRPQS